mgnify:CR=1 FL=1
MKSLKLIAVGFGLIAGAVAYGQGSEIRNVGDFTGIMAAGETRIEVSQAEACSVELTGNTDVFKEVVTEVRNGVLEIRVNKPQDAGALKVKVNVKNLNLIQLSGAAQVKSVNQLTVDTIKLSGTGASQYDLQLKAKRIDGIISGASSVKLIGESTQLYLLASGASNYKGYGLVADDAQVMTSGAASVKVNAAKKLVATASGASDIKYVGTATDKTISATGASTIVAKEGGANSSDTTSVRIGDKTVTIVGDDKDDDRSPREKKSNDDDFEFWGGLDFGVNGLLSAQNKVDLPNGFDYLELNYAKSYVFGWNMWQKNIHIVKNYVNLGTGIGATWYHYNFRNAYTLTPNVPYAVATFDSTYNFSRNRLNVAYLNVPLFLEFNTNNNNADRSFHIAVGGQFGYNIFKNKVKQKYEFEGETYKRKVKDDFNVNPFKYDLIARIGYGKFTMFGTYSLSTLFESGKGPVVYPFTAGISLNL